MYCNFLVISQFSKLATLDRLRYDVIKPYEVGSTGHYIRYEGTSRWPFETRQDAILEILPNIAGEHMVFKFCAEKKAALAFLDKPDEATTYRKDDNVDDPNDQDPLHAKCTEIINKHVTDITILNMSAISKNILPPCTINMLIRDISYRRARAYGKYKKHSHQGTTRIALLWDLYIPPTDFMDKEGPLITTIIFDRFKQLVYIAGFLKLVTHIPTEKSYIITPALGDLPRNEIYRYLEDRSKQMKMYRNAV